MMKQYYVYITTNPGRTTLYIGVTNDLARRIQEHFEGKGSTYRFATKYRCYNLIYYEIYANAIEAIAREKQLKGWTRRKKEALIAKENPKWEFLEIR